MHYSEKSTNSAKQQDNITIFTLNTQVQIQLSPMFSHVQYSWYVKALKKSKIIAWVFQLTTMLFQVLAEFNKLQSCIHFKCNQFRLSCCQSGVSRQHVTWSLESINRGGMPYNLIFMASGAVPHSARPSRLELPNLVLSWEYTTVERRSKKQVCGL